jgi:hypothetical protein
VGQLLEKRPIPEIRAFFEARGLVLAVHTTPPRPATSEELRGMSSEVRRARAKDTSTHWADLGPLFRHYARGRSEDDAIRNAAQRYRVEQADPDAVSANPL